MQELSARPTTPADGTSDVHQRLVDLIESERFEMAFQPIVDLRYNEIVGFEALTRVSAESGFAHAGELYEAAEMHGLLWELEATTRLAALRQSRDWPEHVQIFLNCAPQVIEDSRFMQHLMDAVSISQDRCAAQVIVEITERSPHLNMATLGERVDALREQGLQIAIDDVGMGTNGLVRISALRPGWLKLDRALISNIDQDRFRWNLVRYLVQFARACGVQVIAEGIERPEEVKAVRDMGICFGQGFLLGRPTTAPMELLTTVHELHREVIPSHDASASSVSMLRGVKPVTEIDRSVRVTEAAQHLLRDPELPGLCIVQSEHLIGWADRDEVLRAASREDQGAMPVGVLTRHCPTVDAHTVEFAEMFDICATQAQLRDRCPIVLVQANRPMAMVTAQTLLCMAADLFRNASRWSGASGGLHALPSRVACEEHLDAALQQSHAAGRRTDTPLDAAVLDLRGMGRFNRLCGFEQGDHLMADLIQLVRRTMTLEIPGLFFGHLGLDAYLLTAPHGHLLEALHRLVDAFDSTLLPRYETGQCGVGLRIVEIARFTERFTESGDVLRYASQRRSLGQPSDDGSLLIVDERPSALRTA